MLLNCWRRLLRVPWTARRSNQSILKEISPAYSLEGLMLKLKLQHFDQLMQRTDSLEKTLMLGKIESGRRRGRQRMRWLDGITNSTDMSLSKLWGGWWTGRPGVLQSMGSQRVRHNWATELDRRWEPWKILCRGGTWPDSGVLRRPLEVRFVRNPKSHEVITQPLWGSLSPSFTRHSTHHQGYWLCLILLVHLPRFRPSFNPCRGTVIFYSEFWALALPLIHHSLSGYLLANPQKTSHCQSWTHPNFHTSLPPSWISFYLPTSKVQLKRCFCGSSLAVQWVRLHASRARGHRFDTGSGN